MNIETKANIGDTIYYLKQIKRVSCPVCSGTGKICIGSAINPNFESTDKFTESIGEQIAQNITEIMSGNVKEYTCPECGGKKTVKLTGQPQYIVGSGMVIAVEVRMNQDHEDVIYRVEDSTDKIKTVRVLTNKNLYIDLESAEKQCRFMNLKRMLVPLGQIQIPHCFINTIPCNEKLMRRLDEWRMNRKFETEIFVDENLNIFDGYTSYLVYRMLGITNVPVVIWPKDMRK